MRSYIPHSAVIMPYTYDMAKGEVVITPQMYKRYGQIRCACDISNVRNLKYYIGTIKMGIFGIVSFVRGTGASPDIL